MQGWDLGLGGWCRARRVGDSGIRPQGLQGLAYPQLWYQILYRAPPSHLLPCRMHVVALLQATLAISVRIGRQLRPECTARSVWPRADADVRKRALVVGGGVAGLSNALELAQRGWAVTVLSRDRDEAATLAAGGMLAPQSERISAEGPDGDLLRLAIAARSYFPEWARRVEAASGMSIGMRASGGFIAPAFEGDAVHTWRPPAEAGDARWLSPAEAKSLEPLLSDDICGGWWYPQDMSLDPRALHAALLAACTASGVALRHGEEATALELCERGERLNGVRLADGSVLDADALLLCSGAWLRELLPVPVRPIKGQMLALRNLAPTHMGLSRVLFADGCYIIPRADGRVIVGATVEPERGYCMKATAGGIHQLLGRAIATIPELKHYELDETWAGLRPSTPDLLPLLGATPWANVHLTAGYQ